MEINPKLLVSIVCVFLPINLLGCRQLNKSEEVIAPAIVDISSNKTQKVEGERTSEIASVDPAMGLSGDPYFAMSTPQPTALLDISIEVIPSQTPMRSPAPFEPSIPLNGKTGSDLTALESIVNAAPIRKIGLSAGGYPIMSYRFGSGDIHMIFVGGIHGGYEWNTILLAERVIEHLQDHPDLVPPSMTIHIIPNANPDGLYLVAGKLGDLASTDIVTDTLPGRFNGNGVDLNRNWGCRWSNTAVWRDQAVSGGLYPFSEPETYALRNFFIEVNPALVVFWHSAANGIYVGGCPTPDEPSYRLALLYGQSSGYPVYTTFDHYEVTGDASDWLTTQSIPSISVELTSHDALDWEQNLAGVTELLASYTSAAQEIR